MNDPQINVDHFYHRPAYHVVGLLTEHAEIPVISSELKSAGVDVAAVEILCGERGAAILDEHGRYHRLRARVVRAFQRLGYDEETLETYDEALRHGDLLLQVPVRPADRYHIAALLQRHQVHDVGYFGPGTFEQFPSPIRADPDLPRNSWPPWRLVRPGPRAMPAACPKGGSHPAIHSHSRRNRTAIDLCNHRYPPDLAP